MKRKFNFLLAAVGGLFLAGCASSPFPKEASRQARGLTVAEVSANPGSYNGEVVVWGGSILQTVNETNRGAIYVLAYPLRSDQSPDENKPSIGRFIARQNGLADPQEFQNGRRITVLGRISGSERQPIQKTTYDYPVVAIEQTKIWHRTQPQTYNWYPPYYDDWLLSPYGPGWWGPPPVIIRGGGGRGLHH